MKRKEVHSMQWLVIIAITFSILAVGSSIYVDNNFYEHDEAIGTYFQTGLICLCIFMIIELTMFLRAVYRGEKEW